LREDSASLAQDKAFAKKKGNSRLLARPFRLGLQGSSGCHLVSPDRQRGGSDRKCGKIKTVLENGGLPRPAFWSLCGKQESAASFRSREKVCWLAAGACWKKQRLEYLLQGLVYLLQGMV